MKQSNWLFLLFFINMTGAAAPLSLGGNAVTVQGESVATTTTFTGGIAVNQHDQQATVTMNLSEPVAVTGTIAVERKHVGQVADLILYAGLTQGDAQLYYMLTEAGDILPWDENPAHLVAFKSNVTLAEQQSVTMYQGHFLLPGQLTVFFGYRLDEVVVTNSQPIEITIIPGQARPTSRSYAVMAFNDLGMHCMEKEFSVFAILPPFNVVHAQVIKLDNQGNPELVDDENIEVRFSPVTDTRGTINSTSVNKTDFWSYAPTLFGKSFLPGEGLTGLYMPADTTDPPPMSYDKQRQWFSAVGIPITAQDDNLQKNYYPLLRITAIDKTTEQALTATDIVVPVSDEIDCRNCHASGELATQKYDLDWAQDEDLNVQAKKNILLLHDYDQGTSLATQTPVLCASCHYSPALDLTGAGPQTRQLGKPFLSRAMHTRHAFLDDQATGMEKTCYQCHPGQQTNCLRTIMRHGGLECRECHGGMQAVAGQHPLQEDGSLDGKNDGLRRRPWQDLPRCQSCHTGDAVDHLTGDKLVVAKDGLRLFQAFKQEDVSASPLLAKNQRFAENEHTLYRNSKGHGGIACEACHGSTHAEWPTTEANDNVAAEQLQGHAGKIIECNTCHTNLPLTLAGPHGLHNVNDSRWVANGSHAKFYRRDQESCQACHGQKLEGTVLSKVAADRSFQVEGRLVELKKDTQVSCSLCHRKP